MHGLLFNIKSDKDRYNGAEFQVNYKIYFKTSDHQWPNNVARSFFINNLRKGSPSEVKDQCYCSYPKEYDRFYHHLENLARTGLLQDIGARLDVGQSHDFSYEGIILTCRSEIIY